ncbi:small metal-binding protein SmbP [Nitrosomonas supralitoralis]|uniref:small metal-binding protein SmbP n=1 Tax=Nitrosomonas supralitoralis TaxID=2116706 RepID=UPI001F5BB2DC|nr:small metal-binding protein SmbP [Nitrosomonas supralitoralis]
MKNTKLITSILIMILFSFGVFAETNNLDQAVQHAEVAAKSANLKAIANYSEEAKKYSNAAKNNTDHQIDSKHLDKGIDSLNNAIKMLM